MEPPRTRRVRLREAPPQEPRLLHALFAAAAGLCVAYAVHTLSSVLDPQQAPPRPSPRRRRRRQARLAERAAAAERADSSSGSDEDEDMAAHPPPVQPDTAAERENDAMYARALQAAAFAAEDAAAYGSADPATSVMLEQRFGPGMPAAPLPQSPGSPAFRDAPPELRSLPAQPSTLDAGAPGSAARLTQAEALVWSAAAAIAAQQRRRADDEEEQLEAAASGGGGRRDAGQGAAAAHRPLSTSSSAAAMRGGFSQGVEQSRVEAAAAVAARSFAAALQPLSAAPPPAAAGPYGTR